MSEQWGPWIEHDGKGCPSIIISGLKMEFIYRSGERHGGMTKPNILAAPNWVWPKSNGKIFPTDCMSYRIRKPRALQDLIKLVEELPEGVDA